MSPRDFDIRDSGGSIVSGKYSISVIGGGLAILPTTNQPTVNPAYPVNPPNTGLRPGDSWKYLAALVGGTVVLLAGRRALLRHYMQLVRKNLV